MPTRILHAVADPPKMMFVPVNVAGMNMVVWVALMMMSQAAGIISNPIMFIFFAIGSHVMCIILGFKEPHLSTLLPAKGLSYKRTRNLIKPKGFKQRYAA